MDNPFLKARAVLKERGWRQGGFGRDGGPVCMLGALGAATKGDGYEADYDVDLWQFLGNALGVFSVSDWNDERGRTVDEVDAALALAAEKWEESHD